MHAQPRGNDHACEADCSALSGMQLLASVRNIAILIVPTPTEPMSTTVSGTRGLTGAADAVLVLRKDFASKWAKLTAAGETSAG